MNILVYSRFTNLHYIRSILDQSIRVDNYKYNVEGLNSAFWNTVGALIPDYEDRRQWLKINGRKLTV